MHFAAFKDVAESVKDPLKYYINNVAATMHLLDAMLRHKVNIIIFSSQLPFLAVPMSIASKKTLHAALSILMAALS